MTLWVLLAIVFVAGARWLTNEVDEKLLRAAGTVLASSPANPELAARIGSVSPAAGLHMATGKRS